MISTYCATSLVVVGVLTAPSPLICYGETGWEKEIHSSPCQHLRVWQDWDLKAARELSYCVVVRFTAFTPWKSQYVKQNKITYTHTHTHRLLLWSPINSAHLPPLWTPALSVSPEVTETVRNGCPPVNAPSNRHHKIWDSFCKVAVTLPRRGRQCWWWH